VARKYRNAHELANASVSEVEKLLVENVTPPQQGQDGQQPPAGDQQPQ
jgi:hypothetical protein